MLSANGKKRIVKRQSGVPLTRSGNASQDADADRHRRCPADQIEGLDSAVPTQLAASRSENAFPVYRVSEGPGGNFDDWALSSVSPVQKHFMKGNVFIIFVWQEQML